jgi:hypothetical protein
VGFAQPQTNTTVLDPVTGEKEARELVAQLLAVKPSESSSNSGVFKIRDAKGKRTEIPATFQIVATATNWMSIYAATPTNEATGMTLVVVHADHKPNEYLLSESGTNVSSKAEKKVTGNEAMIPFAGSDFWLADLGLESFYWPKQRLIKKEMRRSQFCKVLESTNPKPAPGAYSRVISWIDHDSLGIMQAEAYDEKGKLLKEFDPKEVQKVGGEWQVREVEMRNRQTGSRTRIEFEVEKN